MRYAYLQFPILGQGSVRAAVASECAGVQGKFDEYHHELFATIQRNGPTITAPDGLALVASGLGLEMQSFNACLNEGKALDLVQADAQAARAAGVRVTPTTIINGTLYEGARDFSFYAARIDAALAGK